MRQVGFKGFLKYLSKTKKLGEWRVSEGGLRLFTKDGMQYCPITAVCKLRTNDFYEADEYYEASEASLLTINEENIVAAADMCIHSVGEYTPDIGDIREKMERAVGLRKAPKRKPGKEKTNVLPQVPDMRETVQVQEVVTVTQG